MYLYIRGANLRISCIIYGNVNHDTLTALGYKQKVVIDVPTLEGHVDGFEVIDSVEYWVHYNLVSQSE